VVEGREIKEVGEEARSTSEKRREMSRAGVDMGIMDSMDDFDITPTKQSTR